MRALDGPIQLADNLDKIVDKIDETYQAWFKIWRDTWVTKLMRAPKWFKGEVDLCEGDLVYFQRTANELGSKYSKWTIGKVDEIERSADNIIRRVWVKYRNAGERHFQRTDRSVRSLIKIFSLLDSSIQEDLAEVSRFMSKLLAGNCDNAATSDKVAEHATTVGSAETDYCCSAHVNFLEVQQLMSYFARKDNDFSEFEFDISEEIHYGDGFEEELSSSLTRAVLRMEAEY